MTKTKKETDTTISMRMNSDTINQLKELAREQAYNSGQEISYVDLIRQAVENKYLNNNFDSIIENFGFYDSEIEEAFLKSEIGLILQKCIDSDNYSEFINFAQKINNNHLENSLVNKLLAKTKGKDGFCRINREPMSVGYVIPRRGAVPECITEGESIMVPKFQIAAHPTFKEEDLSPISLYTSAFRSAIALEKELISSFIPCAIVAAEAREQIVKDSLTKTSMLKCCSNILQHNINVSAIMMHTDNYTQLINLDLIKNPSLKIDKKGNNGTFFETPIYISNRIDRKDILFFGPRETVGVLFQPNGVSIKRSAKPEKLREGYINSVSVGVCIANDWPYLLLR